MIIWEVSYILKLILVIFGVRFQQNHVNNVHNRSQELCVRSKICRLKYIEIIMKYEILIEYKVCVGAS